MLWRCLFKIYGKVQGVSFRYYAKREAEQLGITGWIKNERNGTVIGEAEGEEKTLKQFFCWCQKGSPQARVEKVEMKKKLIKFRKFNRFFIK